MIKHKDIILEYIKKAELESNSSDFGLTTIEIADALNMYRSNVSALLNRMVDEKILEKKGTRPLKYSIYKYKDKKDVFEDLIGYDASLKNAVQLAKAAIMYPQEKLSTLIVAPNGSGTSYLVRLMYEYGINTGILKEDEKLIKIDCSHYMSDDNEQRYDTDGGMLFLDNVDLLEEKYLSNLIEILKNKRLDDRSYENIRIVVACNDMANPSLINELSSIVPIKIELPELSKRLLNEKFELINRFFSIESERANSKLEVPASAISALLLYEPDDNVKGLNRDIKVACANAYARNFVEKKEIIKIYLNDFSNRVKDAYLNMRTNKDDVNSIVDEDDIFIYDGKETSKKYSNYSESKTLYDDLEKQLNALSDRGVDNNTIQDLISNSLTNLIGEDINKREISTEQISKLVDKKIIEMTRNFIEMCQNKLNKRFKPSVFYGLALHLNALIFNNVRTVKVPDDTINDVINNHSEEYKLAISLGLMIKEEYDVELSIDDMTIISSFIIGQKENVESYPKLLYVLHGMGTAESLKNVTEQLCKTNNVYAYNMLLEDDIEKSYLELKKKIIDIDGGSGVIVIYDMGSIATMLNRISNETRIQIRSIYQPITLIGIDVARKAAMEKDIDQIYNSIYVDMANYKNSNEKPKAIITLCNTGEGGASILSDYIDKNSKLEYKTFPLAISDRRILINEVDKIREDYNIYCCVGTYNPNLYNVPFINISDVFSVRSEDLDLILKFERPNYTNSDYNMICDYLMESSSHLNEDDIKNCIFPFIANVKKIYSLDVSVETGLIVHVAALVDHILSNKKIKPNIEKELYKIYEDDFKIIKKFIKDIEKRFKIIISDDDIMLIVKMIKKV